MKRRDFLKSAAAGFAALPVICDAEAAQSQMPKVQLGVPVDATIYLPAMIGVTLGYFREEGIDFELMSLGGGSNVRQAIAAGQIPFAVADIAHPLAMTGSGRRSKVLMATDTRATVANIMVRKDLWDQGITSIEAIAKIKRPDGAKPQIAVIRVGSATWVYGKYILGKVGLEDAVEFVSIPDGAATLGALRMKRIDGIVSNNINYFAVLDDDLGRPVFDTSDKSAWDRVFGSSVASQCAFALESELRKAPDQTQAVVNGLYRGLQYIKANPPEKLYEAIKKDYLTTLEPKAVIREISYMRPIFDFDGAITKTAYENGKPIWFNEATKIKPQPYEDMVDFSFLEKAKKKYG